MYYYKERVSFLFVRTFAVGLAVRLPHFRATLK